MGHDMVNLTNHQFSEVCKLTLELTKLRQNEVKHLAVENAAPEILSKLLEVFEVSVSGAFVDDEIKGCKDCTENPHTGKVIKINEDGECMSCGKMLR